MCNQWLPHPNWNSKSQRCLHSVLQRHHRPTYCSRGSKAESMCWNTGSSQSNGAFDYLNGQSLAAVLTIRRNKFWSLHGQNQGLHRLPHSQPFMWVDTQGEMHSPAQDDRETLTKCHRDRPDFFSSLLGLWVPGTRRVNHFDLSEWVTATWRQRTLKLFDSKEMKC